MGGEELNDGGTGEGGAFTEVEVGEFCSYGDRREGLVGDAGVCYVEVGEVWEAREEGGEDCGREDGVFVEAESSDWEERWKGW